MIKHFIIIGSAYSLGKRIALHYFDKDILQLDVIDKDIKRIYQECGTGTPIACHSLQLEHEGWDDVVESDEFYKDIEVIDNIDKFIDILQKDRELSGVDIARYILTTVTCTHLKLEKLVYLAYADYLCESNDKLFNDLIYAYKLGPIIKSVYSKYKVCKSNLIDSKEDNKTTYDESNKYMPIRSRILAARDGVRKLYSIDKTIEKYGKYDAYELVKITHKKNSPWRKTGYSTFSKVNKQILDEIILKYHINEEV